MKYLVLKSMMIMLIFSVINDVKAQQGPPPGATGCNLGTYMCTTCNPTIPTDGETMGFIRGDVAAGADLGKWRNGDYTLIGNGQGQAGYWIYKIGSAFIVVPIIFGSGGGSSSGVTGTGGVNTTSGSIGADNPFFGGCDIVNPTFWDNC